MGIISCNYREKKGKRTKSHFIHVKECSIEIENEDEVEQITRERIHNMLSFVQSINDWYEKIRSISNATLRKIMQLGNTITKLVGK